MVVPVLVARGMIDLFPEDAALFELGADWGLPCCCSINALRWTLSKENPPWVAEGSVPMDWLVNSDIVCGDLELLNVCNGGLLVSYDGGFHGLPPPKDEDVISL